MLAVIEGEQVFLDSCDPENLNMEEEAVEAAGGDLPRREPWMWIEPRRIEATRPRERTEPLYPTRAPDGSTWHERFAGYRATRSSAATEPDEEDDEPDEREVIERGYDMTQEERAALSARSSLRQIDKRLAAAGWDVRVRRSLVRVPAVRYKTTTDEHQEGDVRYEEYVLETFVLIAVKRAADGRVGLAMEGTWEKRGDKALTFKLAKTYDPLLGTEIRVGSRKGREPNEIEIEEGVQPPIGLMEWLGIVAPK